MMNPNAGVSGSNGVSGSYGVSRSNGVTGSYGVNGSNGVNWSYGVSGSYGVNWSCGVSGSYGVNWSYGVSDSIFCLNRKRVFRIFEKEVTQVRFHEVWDQFHKHLNGWHPKPNNAFTLYDAAGREWSKVDALNIKENDNKTAWADMPKAAIEYLKSLPEFDAEIFTGVTEIDLSTTCVGKVVEIDGKKYKLVEV